MPKYRDEMFEKWSGRGKSPFSSDWPCLVLHRYQELWSESQGVPSLQVQHQEANGATSMYTLCCDSWSPFTLAQLKGIWEHSTKAVMSFSKKSREQQGGKAGSRLWGWYPQLLAPGCGVHSLLGTSGCAHWPSRPRLPQIRSLLYPCQSSCLPDSSLS